MRVGRGLIGLALLSLVAALAGCSDPAGTISGPGGSTGGAGGSGAASGASGAGAASGSGGSAAGGASGSAASGGSSECASPAAASKAPVSGGLTELPKIELGPNLLVNPGFEDVVSGKPSGWNDNGFSSDASVAKSGSKSYELTNAPSIPYVQSASQTVSFEAGSYRMQGFLRMQGLAATSGNGVRLRVDAPGDAKSTTEIFSGTSDWQLLDARAVAPTAGSGEFRLEAHGEPDGTAWFDDVALVRELPPPVDVYLEYPNYRGMLFDDQPAVVRMHLGVAPPAGQTLGELEVEALLLDASGGALASKKLAAESELEVELDACAVGANAVTATARVLDAGQVIYTHPGYSVARVKATARDTMPVSFDEHARVLLHGTPKFVLGVYDSGMGYNSDEAGWKQRFDDERRLFELPINFYLNYWYGEAPVASLSAMMNVLGEKGIFYFQTGNCFERNRDTFPIDDDDSYLSGLASHPWLGGFYTMDECDSDLSRGTFDQYKRLRSFDPDGATFGASNHPNELSFWRNAVDLLSTDPYPLYGAEPAGGYPLDDVSKWTTATRQAVRDSRPIVTVLQFFQSTSLGRWPTQAELRNMSYMAIADGADGLVYWSLGANALAYVCSGWCTEKSDYFERLKAVMLELDGLSSALAGLDQDALLASSSESAIHTKVKVSGGKAWLIASNVTSSNVAADFSWSAPITSVPVYAESRTLTPSGSSFSDAFAPYEAHVYELPGG